MDNMIKKQTTNPTLVSFTVAQSFNEFFKFPLEINISKYFDGLDFLCSALFYLFFAALLNFAEFCYLIFVSIIKYSSFVIKYN